MGDLVLVKLGGSLITDKSRPYTPRMDVIRRLAAEIREARSGKKIPLIVGHGGGSFPHTSAKKYRTHLGAVSDESYRGVAVVQNDAAKLNRIVVEELIKAGENAISVQPSSSAVAEDSRIVKWDTEPVGKMVECGLLPVPYGDVCLDLRKGCCILSTEEVLGYLARKLGGRRVIMAGKVDGVFTSDPGDRGAELIPEITPDNFGEVKRCLGGSDGIDVTGGMLLKVAKMLELAKEGIQTEIINAAKPGYLKRALLGETGLGTVVKA